MLENANATKNASVRAMNPPMTPTLAKVALGLLAIIAAVVLVDATFIAEGASLTREGGGLETVSAFFYAVAITVFFAMVPSNLWRPLFHIPTLLLLFGLRELDMDKAFTQRGILTTGFYSGDSAIAVKLVGGAVAVCVLFILYRVLRHGVPAVWHGVRAGETWPWFALLAGILVIATKLADGLARNLMEMGIVLSDDLDLFVTTAEETGEAFIPLCAILAIVSRWKGRNP